MPFVFVCLSGLAFAMLGLSYKLADHFQCRSMPFIAVFTGFGALVALGRSFFEVTMWEDPRLWLLGAAMGVLLFFGIRLVVYCNRLGPASITWTVVNLSLLVPIFLTPLFFHESVHLLDLLLVALFIAMLKLFDHGAGSAGEIISARRPWFIGGLCTLMLVNGLFQFGMKVATKWFDSSSAGGVSALLYLMAMSIALLVYLRRHGAQVFTRHEWLVGGCAGLSSSIGILLLMAGMTLPAIIAYPLSQGIALLGGILLTALLFHESLHPAKLLGFAAGVLMLLVAVFRDTLAKL